VKIFMRFSRKFSRNFVPFSRDFRIFAKIEKCIFVSPHRCLFYPHKMRCHSKKKLHHMYYACRITVKFKGFFVFEKIFVKRNFAKIVPFSHYFRENWKMHFRFNPNIHYSILVYFKKKKLTLFCENWKYFVTLNGDLYEIYKYTVY
jgi:hypothetical protein